MNPDPLLLLRRIAAALALLAIGAPAAAAVTALNWTGKATIHLDDRVIEIGVATALKPFGTARSRTWLLSEGEASARTLVIEQDGGWAERASGREALPDAMVRHEQQQYALYGLMLRAMGHETVPVPAYAPTTRFEKDAAGQLTSATNAVLDPDGAAAPIPQTIRFAGRIESRGVAWPTRIDIYERGKLYFSLRIDSFQAVAD